MKISRQIKKMKEKKCYRKMTIKIPKRQTSDKNVVFGGGGGGGGLFFAGTEMTNSFKAQSAFRQPHVQAIPTERKHIEPIAFNIFGF